MLSKTAKCAIERAYNLNRLLDETYFELIERLFGQEEAAVSDLQHKTGKSRSTVYYRLLSLSAMGIVKTIQRRRHVRVYTLANVAKEEIEAAEHRGEAQQ